MRLVGATALIVGALGALAAETPSRGCLPYEPQIVSLAGRLERKTFPGRPSYESVEEGDEAETGFYLELEKPVCTVGGEADAPDRYPERDVRLVQLVLDSAGFDRLRPRLGEQITLRGTLFAAHTGHHHAPLLMKVVWDEQP